MRPFHPVSEIFPLLEGQAFTELVEDIRKNGLQHDILIHPDGRIVDGRNRYRACERAGVPPRYTKVDPNKPLLPLVISLNLHRRHLDESQRAMVASKIAEMRRGRPVKNAGIQAISQTQAAEMLNVSRASVQDATKLRKSATPEIVSAVENGEMSLHAATKAIKKPAAQIAAEAEKTKWTFQAIRAFENLATMTVRPADYAANVDPSLAKLIDRNLPAALAWLNDFAAEWRKR